jgi:hypothetical protein
MTIPLSWRGTFDITKVYEIGDIVYFEDNGFTYVTKRRSYAVPPYLDSNDFEVFTGVNITSIDGGEF